jgi:hypothetical protein
MLSLGYSQLAAGSMNAAAKRLADGTAGAIPGGTRVVLFQAEAQAVRWRDDNVAPTASVGMLLPAGQSLWYDYARFDRLQFFAAAAGAALNVTYYG